MAEKGTGEIVLYLFPGSVCIYWTDTGTQVISDVTVSYCNELLIY